MNLCLSQTNQVYYSLNDKTDQQPIPVPSQHLEIITACLCWKNKEHEVPLSISFWDSNPDHCPWMRRDLDRWVLLYFVSAVGCYWFQVHKAGSPSVAVWLRETVSLESESDTLQSPFRGWSRWHCYAFCALCPPDFVSPNSQAHNGLDD